MSTKHLVTGSSGFLGRKIIQRLVNEGKEVIGVDILKEENPVSGVKYVVSDIRDEFRIEEQLNGISIVYHTAALVPLTKFKDASVEPVGALVI